METSSDGPTRMASPQTRAFAALLTLLLATLLAVVSCASKPTVPEVLETTINGRVVDAQTGNPITSATLSTVPVTEQALTNAEGLYVLRANVEVGRSYRVTATASGYVQNSITVTVNEGESAIADLRLSPSVPQLQVAPDTLDFEATAQSRSIVIENGGSGDLSWRVTVPSEDWLQVSPLTGRTAEQASTVIVSVDRSRVKIDGQYRVEVVIASDGGTQVVVVTMLVEGTSPAPQLSVSPVSLAFGSTSTQQTIGVSNAGSGPLTWHVTPSHDWISASPDSGTTTGSADQLTVVVDRSRLTPGEHAASLDIVSSGGSRTVAVTASVPVPVLVLSTRDVDFRTDLEVVTLQISNTGTGELTWSFESDLSWLTVAAMKGTTGQVTTPIRLSVNRHGMAAGLYEGALRLTSNSTSEPEVNIGVRMQVLALPEMALHPDSLDFGRDEKQLSLAIGNANNGTLTWQIDVTRAWIQSEPASGEVGLLDSTSVAVHVRRTGLAAGTHQADLTVSSNGGTRTIPIRIEVEQAPRLSVSAQTLDFGGSIRSQTLEIRNAGTGRMRWTIDGGADWLEVSLKSGTTLDEVDGITLAVNRQDLPPGTYTTTVGIHSDGGDFEVVVEMVAGSQLIDEADAVITGQIEG